MSFPNIPNITPAISISTAQTIPLLLSSIALEELALAHIINAEAEKLQFVLGTLPPGRTTLSPSVVTISNLLTVNSSVQRTLRDVIKKEMLLEFKFENVLDLLATITPPPSPTVTITLEADPTTICASSIAGPVPNTSTLTGQVLVNGSPAPAGTPVNFTVDDPALGIVVPNPAFTDASGNFTATYTATAIGVTEAVIITATALGASDTVTITIIDCSILGLSVNIDADNVCSSGTGPNTTTVSGQVLVNGSPAPAGTPVNFTVDNPALATISPNPAFTDASGNYTATFTAIDGPGTVSVTATFPTVGVGTPPPPPFSVSIDIDIVDCP